MSLSTNKYHCNTAQQGRARHNQRWRTVVSCFQVEYPAPGSAAPASRCARTTTATVPATIGEHPANIHTDALKGTSRTNLGGEKIHVYVNLLTDQTYVHHVQCGNVKSAHKHHSQDSNIHNCSAPSFPFHFSKSF